VVVHAKANVPYDTLKVLKDNGLRLLLVGLRVRQPEDPEQREEGHPPRHGSAVYRRREGARHQDSRHVHSGLPGETRETIQETIRFAGDIDPDTIQVSIAAPYRERSCFVQAVENGWLSGEALVTIAAPR